MNERRWKAFTTAADDAPEPSQPLPLPSVAATRSGSPAGRRKSRVSIHESEEVMARRRSAADRTSRGDPDARDRTSRGDPDARRRLSRQNSRQGVTRATAAIGSRAWGLLRKSHVASFLEEASYRVSRARGSVGDSLDEASTGLTSRMRPVWGERRRSPDQQPGGGHGRPPSGSMQNSPLSHLSAAPAPNAPPGALPGVPTMGGRFSLRQQSGATRPVQELEA